MSQQYYLAIDIGASSGRHILGSLEDGIIRLEEVHRFPNGMTHHDGSLCWDTEGLFTEILNGMKKCAQMGKVPASVGIDTWGVDFVLIDKNGELTAPSVAYRDSRTDGMDAEVYKRIPETELYTRTGIQKQIFNTIYQLMAVTLKTPEYFENATHLLFMPDFLHYKLCGAMKNEYTISSTTGLLDAVSGEWDDDIMSKCGFPRELFCEITMPGTTLGNLTEDIKNAVGYDCKVVLPPSHDTASAFLAVPAKSNNSVYISSGTWSLMGVELSSPITTKASFEANMSNEGGYERRFRYLNNIMGLWMIQSVRKELAEDLSYAEIAELAAASDYKGTVDVDDNRFFAPSNMAEEVRMACREGGFEEPVSIGDLANCIYRSLALSYAKTVKRLEALTGNSYDSINIIGGGSNNTFLNELTAKTCKLPVYAGPAEGTALGNIISQMITSGDFATVDEARRAIRKSFEIAEYR